MPFPPPAPANYQDLLRTILNSIPDVICSKDRELRFTGGNEAFEALAGRPLDELLGQTCHAIFTEPWADRARAAEAEVIRSGEPLHAEDWVTYPDGRRVLLDIRFEPVRADSGEMAGLIVIGRDVTDRRRLEDQLRQSQKLDAVGQLAGGIAHDFNNLLTVILSNLSLARTLPSPRLLEAAETAAQRAADLTGQLLKFARRQPMRSEPLDVNARLCETAALIRSALDPRVMLVLEPCESPAIVKGDPVQIEQVLLNLCLNARDAMPEGGTLRMASAVDNGDVMITVGDTGAGMSPEVRARIFEPFFTTKNLGQGTGLGLAVAFGIVQAHGGTIACDSRVGVGTRFDIRLPSHAADVPAVANVAAPVSSTLAGRNILFADDEPAIRELARLILEPKGCRVTCAEDGQDAVEKFLAAGGNFDLVMLDLTMPNLTGRDAFDCIRARKADVRVLLTSGYSPDRPAVIGTDCGFLEKPFTPAQFAAAVERALANA